MSPITLLGPQVREPNLRHALRELAITGPFVSITAGWQERESEVEELSAHVGESVRDLKVYERTEQVFARDQELRAAHRRRQTVLHEMQELYRVRLEHEKRAARELFEREGDAELLRAARRQAVAALRRLDRAHIQAIRRVHAQFAEELRPLERPQVRAASDDLVRQLGQANAVFIAGGHVAVLLNRLRLLGAARWLGEKRIVAWSAGAMVLCEAVVLFHDHPPQGASNVEVFDAGLGLVSDTLVFPHSQQRLSLHDTARVALIARRFAPAACRTLDPGSCLHFEAGRLVRQAASWQFTRRGPLMQVPE
jgi:hypothetical protein